MHLLGNRQPSNRGIFNNEHHLAISRSSFDSFATYLSEKIHWKFRFLTETVGVLYYNPQFLTSTFHVLVNGGYTEWNGWAPCSVTCGRGIKKRQRFCTNPEPAYGGVACGHLGSGEEVVQCYDVNCPGK